MKENYFFLIKSEVQTVTSIDVFSKVASDYGPLGLFLLFILIFCAQVDVKGFLADTREGFKSISKIGIKIDQLIETISFDKKGIKESHEQIQDTLKDQSDVLIRFEAKLSQQNDGIIRIDGRLRHIEEVIEKH